MATVSIFVQGIWLLLLFILKLLVCSPIKTHICLVSLGLVRNMSGTHMLLTFDFKFQLFFSTRNHKHFFVVVVVVVFLKKNLFHFTEFKYFCCLNAHYLHYRMLLLWRIIQMRRDAQGLWREGGRFKWEKKREIFLNRPTTPPQTTTRDDESIWSREK